MLGRHGKLGKKAYLRFPPIERHKGYCFVLVWRSSKG